MEPFEVYAANQLKARPLGEPGVCMNPGCSQVFAPSRDWQSFCSAACRRIGEIEFRKIGVKAAPGLLAWTMGKHETREMALRELAKAGRRHVSAIGASWLRDRRLRAGAARDR